VTHANGINMSPMIVFSHTIGMTAGAAVRYVTFLLCRRTVRSRAGKRAFFGADRPGETAAPRAEAVKARRFWLRAGMQYSKKKDGPSVVRLEDTLTRYECLQKFRET
jgi:hypothetical protein